MDNKQTWPPTDQSRQTNVLRTDNLALNNRNAGAASIIDLLGMPEAAVEFEPVRIDLVLQPES